MRLEILLIAADPGARDYVLRYVGPHRVTVAASPPEATTLLAAHRYGLVLVTNFGIRPDEALVAIPARRDYPVLFLTGCITDRIEKACVEKAIPMLRIPEAIDMLRGEIRLVLEDLRIRARD
jgi:hypothetical protein